MRGFEPVLDPISTLLAVSFEIQLPWYSDAKIADSMNEVYLRILVHGAP